jgi:hypothetical protein
MAALWDQWRVCDEKGNEDAEEAEKAQAKTGQIVAIPEAHMLGYALEGVLRDVEAGNGFDEACLATIRRVRADLAAAPVDLETLLQTLLIDRRILITKEYEGAWRADLYGDEVEPIAVGFGATLREAVVFSFQNREGQ